MYNTLSSKATEFIDNEEVLQTIKFAKENKSNYDMLRKVLQKAELIKGLSHKEATLLLFCDLEEINKKIFQLAKVIKNKIYGNRIVLFAPIYLSNYCINGCVYCPYNHTNKDITRIKLTQEQIKQEVIALQNMGHKRLAVEAGEHPVFNSIDYILESIKTIYSVKHKNGSIRRVNVNIAATTVENYERLKNTGIGTYVLFQETYNKERYQKLHRFGPKSNYDYHTESMDRAMQAGLGDVGLGVLFGLDSFEYEFPALLMHAEHLEALFGVGPHTISVPRIKPAQNVSSSLLDNGISDDTFAKIVACIRLAVPYTGIIISTRESKACREKVLNLGVSQISGGSSTHVGGYAGKNSQNSEQFTIDDTRTLDEIVRWLIEMNHVPSFCTSCYRNQRVGSTFMELCKGTNIKKFCQYNSFLTLKEYIEDYATPDTKKIAEKFLQQQINSITDLVQKNYMIDCMKKIESGVRDINV